MNEITTFTYKDYEYEFKQISPGVIVSKIDGINVLINARFVVLVCGLYVGTGRDLEDAKGIAVDMADLTKKQNHARALLGVGV